MTTHQGGPNPLPWTTIHTTVPISSTAAHDFLRAYLDRATTDPALQPDASITEHGPASRTTASAPNLALHNLKRVQAGLAGEVLGKDLSVGEDGNLKVDTGDGDGGLGEGEGEGWEDAKSYEQGQGQGQGKIDEGMQVDEGQDGGTIDKEERKRRKKERRLAEKRAKSGAGAGAAAED